jgi:ADP-heptose:LPS heptosyltransferase
MECLPAPERLLVFRIGQLGDTVVALPALWVLRRAFPQAHITLLCDRHPHGRFVLAADLLRGSGVVDEFVSYVVDGSRFGRWLRPVRMLALLTRLRRAGHDTLAYLAPSTRHAPDVERDRKFFRAAGIRRFLGMTGFAPLPVKQPGQPLGSTAAEADLLLARLAADGLAVPPPGTGSLDLGIGPAEEAEVAAWLGALPGDGNRRWLGVGPGSKMPAKRWPEERFQQVTRELVKSHNVWPVVFGGPEDRAVGDRLVAAAGRGHNAAGRLGLRGSVAALRRCALYVGNDTGTMHLAAAAGTPCVAIFSAREWPGMWFPYGVPQTVLRKQIECEGCTLIECQTHANECLNHISAPEVMAACQRQFACKTPTI